MRYEEIVEYFANQVTDAKPGVETPEDIVPWLLKKLESKMVIRNVDGIVYLIE